MKKGIQFKSISARIFTAFAVLMLVFAVGMYLFVSFAATRMNDRSAAENLDRQGNMVYQLLDNKYEGAWNVRDGNLFKGVYQMNDDNDFPDMIKEQTGLNVTLFLDDTRIATNVITEDGNRAVGTKVSDEVASAVLAKGETYVGYANVAGVSNYTYYTPIYDLNDQIIGMFFIGLPADQVEYDLMIMTYSVLFVMLLGAAIASVISLVIARKIGRQIKDAAQKAGQLSLGDVELEIPEATRSRKDEIGALMRSMNELVESQRARANAAGEIGKGNLEIEIVAMSEKDILSHSMQEMISTLRKMSASVQELTTEAARGNLQKRGNADQFAGVYREIVAGVNTTLDAITKPLSEADIVLDRLSKSDVTVGMTGEYQGDFKKLASQINQVREMYINVQNVCINLAAGDFSLYPALIAAKSEADENNKLLPAMIGMMEAVQNIADQADEVASAAQRGDLEYRADIGQFRGEFKKVIQGLNNALQAMSEPLNEMETVLNLLSNGDLTANMLGEYEGSYKGIKESINTTVSSLSGLMFNILQTSEQVAASAQEISNASGALSQGSTEQASSIEELSASITEIASQTRQNATNASSANNLSQKAHESADRGNLQMKTMLEAMHDINDASTNIAKIIKVIDEIAFQTNILALNAAVEAARAGQHGKGFAVVAEEVRNLAARSAEAARETTQYIESTISKVEGGTEIASETAKSLVEIVDSINETAVLVAEIANASNEQAGGITQINQGIEQVSSVVQNNSATSEETASTSELLSEQAKLLYESISHFRLQ